MSAVLYGCAAALVVLVAAGLVAPRASRTATDRMLGVQLVGTGGIAVLVLLAVADRDAAILDVALLLALLAAMAACAALAVVRQAAGRAARPAADGEGRR